MSTDLVERLRIKSAMLRMGEPIAFGSDADALDEAIVHIRRLENQWSLHRGDVMSLSGDLDRERERANEAETESFRLIDSIAAERRRVEELEAHVRAVRDALPPEYRTWDWLGNAVAALALAVKQEG